MSVTLTNAAFAQGGPFGGQMLVGGYAALPASALPANPVYCLEVWGRFAQAVGTGAALVPLSASQFRIYIDPSNGYPVYESSVTANDIFPPTSVLDGALHHFRLVARAASTDFYVDGVLAGSDTATLPLAATDTLYLGADARNLAGTATLSAGNGVAAFACLSGDPGQVNFTPPSAAYTAATAGLVAYVPLNGGATIITGSGSTAQGSTAQGSTAQGSSGTGTSGTTSAYAPTPGLLPAGTVLMSDTIVDSIGVCAHTFSAPYVNNTAYPVALKAMGIRHLRTDFTDSAGNLPNVISGLTSLVNAVPGLKLHLIAMIPDATASGVMQIINGVGAQHFSAIEGQNEPDNWQAQGLTANWASQTVAYQQSIYQAIKASYPSLPVVSPALLDYAVGDVSSIAGAAQYCDYVAVHAYNQAINGAPTQEFPETTLAYSAFSWYIANFVTAFKAGAPCMFTELGYSTEQGGPWTTFQQGQYNVREVLWAVKNGVTRTFLYEFADEGTGSTNDQLNYGQVTTAFADKPSGTAVANLIALLADPGANFTPTPITVTLSGAPSTVETLVCQRQDGSYQILLWDAVLSGASAPETAHQVTVTTSAVFQSAGYAVIQNTATYTQAALSGGGTSVTVPVSDSVTVLHLVAASSSGATSGTSTSGAAQAAAPGTTTSGSTSGTGTSTSTNTSSQGAAAGSSAGAAAPGLTQFSSGEILTAAALDGDLAALAEAALSPTGNASTATVVSTLGTKARSLADRFADRLTPKDLGAALDGVTDDTAALSAALAATPAGGTLRIQSGKLRLTASPTGSAGVLWQMDGTADANGNPLIYNAGHDLIETYLGSAKMFWRGSSQATDFACLRSDYTVNHTGGTAGGVNANVRVSTTVSGAPATYAWGLVSVLSSTATGSGQHCATYFQAKKNAGGTAQIWATCLEAHDHTGLPSAQAGGLVAAEVDVFCNDADAQGIRVGIDVVVGTSSESTAAADVGWGVRVGPVNGAAGPTVHRPFALGQNTTFTVAAFDASLGKASGGAAAFRMAKGQTFDLSGDGVHVWQYSTVSACAQYVVNGTALMNVWDSGEVDFGAIKLDQSGIGVSVGISGAVGFDTSSATLTGPAFRLAAGQMIALEATGAVTLGYASGVVTLKNGSNLAALAADLSSSTYLTSGAQVAISMAQRAISVSVLEFTGADPTGVSDSTAAINAAIATKKAVHLPAGNYLVTGALNMPNQGQWFFGDGPTASNLRVPSTFSTSAAGVINVTSGEAGPRIQDIGIIFAQPSAPASRSALTAYPPGIYVNASPRTRIERVRVTLGTVGIQLASNCGGTDIIDPELCCFVNGIAIDGSLDSVRIVRPHVFPYALTAQHLAIFNDQNCVGILSGRCDDLHVDGGMIICGKPMRFYQSAAGNTFGQITNCDFDTFGGLFVEAGRLAVSGGTFTCGPGAQAAVYHTGGSLSLTGCHFECTTVPATGSFIAALAASAGSPITIAGCDFNLGSTSTLALLAQGAGCEVAMAGGIIEQDPTYSATQPMIALNAGAGTITGVKFSAPTTATAPCNPVIVNGTLPWIVADCDYGGRSPAFSTAGFAASVQGIRAGSDWVGGAFVGAIRWMQLAGHCDSTGTIVLPHGISGLHLMLVHAQAVYKGGSGEARNMTLAYCDGGNISFNGASASASMRCMIGFANTQTAWT